MMGRSVKDAYMHISNIEKESVAIGDGFEVVENLWKKDEG
jgi:hypothetical protein